MPRFAIQAVTIHATALAGIIGQSFDLGREVDSEGSDGLVHESLHTIPTAKPGCEFSTRQLKTLLTAPFLSAGDDVRALTLNGTTGLVMVGAKQATDSAGYASGSVHLARTALNGVLWLAGIRWSRGQKAEAMVRGLFRSTAGATAATVDSLVALPAQPNPAEAFALTALVLGGSAYTRINSLEITTDAKFSHDYDAGLPNPTAILTAGAGGSIAHRLVADVGEADIAEGSGAVSAVFTKFAQGGGMAADTVTVTFNAAFSIEEGYQGDHGTPIGRRLVARPRISGATKPMTIATG